MFNKSTICTTANKLRAQGYTRSQAFIIAWTLAKGQETKVSGTIMNNRQTAIEHLTRYPAEQVSFTLTREPGNAHDRNAVAVMVSVNGSQPYRIGYIPAAAATVVSAILRNGAGVTARLKAIVGGWAEGISYGLRLCVSL